MLRCDPLPRNSQPKVVGGRGMEETESKLWLIRFLSGSGCVLGEET